MPGCDSCSGNCKSCHNTMELTEPELEILDLLSQFAFLPIGRNVDSEIPLCIFDCKQPPETMGLAMLCLEKKGLAVLDYDMPINGFCDSRYLACPLRGSAALTAKGQQILDLLELQGIE